jgi:uncharacterized protein (TIGR00255 family)
MLKSMTAYGRAKHTSDLGSILIEIQSVNRKFLDINIISPKELAFFDADLRKWINQSLHRGKVTLRVNVDFQDATPLKVTPNIALARQIKHAWEQISDELNMEPAGVQELSRVSEVLNFQISDDHEAWAAPLKEAVLQALGELDKMKCDEGTLIEKDFLERLALLEKWIPTIEKKAPEATEKCREKLKKLFLQEVGTVDEEKLLKEVCVYADRTDITEEVVRFKSHIEHFKKAMESNKGAVGKKLEFILQELGREINTIGSKAQDIEISRLVVEIKNELERIREQVQNVE